MSIVGLPASLSPSLKPRNHSTVMNEKEAGEDTGTGVTKPCVTAAHSWTGVEEWESAGQA